MDTDPYQPVEETCRHTRQTLELLKDKGFSACILTKSEMVTRDIDLLSRMAGSSVGMSFAFHREETRTLFEDIAPPNTKRIEGLKEIKRAGIETYSLISPVMPLLTDTETLIEMLDICSDTIWIYRLEIESLESINWKNIMDIMNRHWPNLVNRFKEAALTKTHSYWNELTEKLIQIKRNRNLDIRIHV
jgi:DNA repair photolyase